MSNAIRDQEIVKARQDGMTCAAIGTLFGISRQRAQQIAGLKLPDGYSVIASRRPVRTCFFCGQGYSNWGLHELSPEHVTAVDKLHDHIALKYKKETP